MGTFVLVAAVIALIVVFAVEAQCPSNTISCPLCTSWMNTTVAANGTNMTRWHIEEICWEHLYWGNLTKQQQFYWSELGQSAATWDKDIQTPRMATNLCWNELDVTELAAATALGYYRETWNCEFSVVLSCGLEAWWMVGVVVVVEWRWWWWWVWWRRCYRRCSWCRCSSCSCCRGRCCRN